MYAPPDYWPGEPRHRVHLEVDLDAGQQATPERLPRAGN
jgi:hypothetical protein